MNLKTILISLSLFLLALIFPPPLQAQTISLSVWPPLVTIVTPPNQTIHQTYQLKNPGDDTTVTVSLTYFQPSDELGHIQLLPNQPAPEFFSLQDSPLPLTFPLKAGESQDLTLTLNIPEDASPADQYLTLLFQAQTPGLISHTGSQTQASLGSNLLLTISSPNPSPPSAKIDSFSLDYQSLGPFQFLDSFSPPPFHLRLKNTGSAFFQFTGHIDIFNSLNQKIATLPLRQDHLLAQQTRQLHLDQPWQPFFPLGHFTAIVNITPQGSPHPISQTLSFYIFPYKLVFLILLFLLLIKLIKRYQKKS